MTLFSPPSPTSMGKKRDLVVLAETALVSIIVTATDFLLCCGTLSSASFNLNEFGQVQLHGAQLKYVIEKIV